MHIPGQKCQNGKKFNDMTTKGTNHPLLWGRRRNLETETSGLTMGDTMADRFTSESKALISDSLANSASQLRHLQFNLKQRLFDIPVTEGSREDKIKIVQQCRRLVSPLAYTVPSLSPKQADNRST